MPSTVSDFHFERVVAFRRPSARNDGADKS